MESSMTGLASSLVLLPCAEGEAWAVPQVCLGEIVTVTDAGESPPEQISWRGREVPVMDRGAGQGAHWRDAPGETGLVAILLALDETSGEHWGVAVNGNGLAYAAIKGEDIEDCPDGVAENAVAAFRYRGTVYQVPDLLAWQKIMAGAEQSATKQ
jgi:hypothetical protein